MMYQLIGASLIAFASTAAGDVSAVVSAFDRDFCRTGASRSDGINLNKLGMKLVSSERKDNITYAVDGPIPKNDVLIRRWEGLVRGGAVTLWNIRIDYETGYDQSTSELGLSDSEYVSENIIKRSMNVVFVPDNRLRGRSNSYRAISENVEIAFWSRPESQTGKREWVISCRVKDK